MLIVNGSDEVEMVIIVDVLRRVGVNVIIVLIEKEF